MTSVHGSPASGLGLDGGPGPCAPTNHSTDISELQSSWLVIVVAADVTNKKKHMLHTTTQIVVQIVPCVKHRIGSDLINFWEVMEIVSTKNLMMTIGHNTSAKWEATRSENLEKTKLAIHHYNTSLFLICAQNQIPEGKTEA